MTSVLSPDRILVAGAGFMASEYLKVLKSRKLHATVIGRGERRVNELKEHFPEATFHSGGIQAYLSSHEAPAYAIVAVNVEQLFNCTKLLIEKGCKHILVEKPVALNMEELLELKKLAAEKDAAVFVAYNRRFYTSVELVKELVAKDGGILSAHFEFTEWVHTINPALYDKEALEKWIVSNSTHVIDLVFSLIGPPEELHAYVKQQKIDWHPSGAVFTGAGISAKHIPFTYHSNWISAGRWNIELLTPENRYYFSPMEKLRVQKRGTVNIDEVEADYTIDTRFKAGLYKMVDAFLHHSPSAICTLEEHIQLFPAYCRIGGYPV